LVVALVGAVGLSLMISPAEASTSTLVHRGPVAGLVVHPCTPPVNALDLALRAAARALAGHAVVLRAEAAKLHAVHVLTVVDVDVTAVNTGLGGTATAVGSGWYATDVDVTALNTGVAGSAVAVADVHRARNVDVTAVNTGLAGTAVAVADVHRARDVDVTAVNTATLGTAVAVATPSPASKRSTENTSSNVTAVNTGILGTAIAVGGGGNGDVTAVNTGILGTAIAVGA
jgi:hypothetical protein